MIQARGLSTFFAILCLAGAPLLRRQTSYEGSRPGGLKGGRGGMVLAPARSRTTRSIEDPRALDAIERLRGRAGSLETEFAAGSPWPRTLRGFRLETGRPDLSQVGPRPED